MTDIDDDGIAKVIQKQTGDTPTRPDESDMMTKPRVSGPPAYEPAKKPVDGQTEIRNVSTRKTYKDSGIVTHEEFTDGELITIGLPMEGVPLAEVQTGSRMTINLGNFESVQVEVSVALPCYVEEIEECYKTAKHIVDGHLNQEIQAIRDYRDSKKSGENHGG